ncbi:unnamed protein product, partial [Mesorhabditis spiculigera]
MAVINALPESSMFDADLDEFSITELRTRTPSGPTPGSGLMKMAKLLWQIQWRFMGIIPATIKWDYSQVYTKKALHEYKIQVHEANVYAPGKVITEKSIFRILLSPNVERIVVDSAIDGVIFKPKGNGPFPAIIDIYGMLGAFEQRAALLAEKGFAVLALTVFGGKRTPKTWQQNESTYFLKAIDWILAQPYASKTVGVIGISAGGGACCYMASKHPKVSAAILLNSRGYPTVHSVFKENGKLLPLADIPLRRLIDTDCRQGAMNYAKTDDGLDVRDEIFYKIEDSNAIFLLVAGGQDGSQNSALNAKLIMERMSRLGKAENFEMLVLPNTGHNIEPPYVPVQDIGYAKNLDLIMDFGGHTYLQNVDQRKLWPKMNEFLKNNVPVEKAKL